MAARRLWIPAAALLPLLLLPAAVALPFTGPGQTGSVRIGDDGLLAGLGTDPPGPLADNLSAIHLDGIPADACRLVLDENGTYARTHNLWSPGDPTARLYADAGATDAPFRIHALWHTDLNGNCTAEETVDGTLWHDPRGRPFIEPRVLDRRPVHDATPGMTLDLAIRVHNNGTLPANVTGRIHGLPDGWTGGSAGATTNVPIDPLATASFPFRLTIPETPQSRMTLVRISFLTTDWNDEAVVFLQFPDSATPPSTNAPQPAITPEGLPAPQWTPAEAPAPAPLALVAALAALLIARRAPRPAPTPP